MFLFSHLTLWSICAAKKTMVDLCNPGPRRNRVWPASPFLPPISSHSYQSVKILVKTQQVSKLTFVFRLPVDEHTLKLQLLFELLDIGQLHVRAGWIKIKTLQMNEQQPVWRGLWRRGRSVSASGRHRHHGRAES